MFCTPLQAAIESLKYPDALHTGSKEWALATLRSWLGKDFGDDIAAWEECAKQHPNWSFKPAAKATDQTS
jgi:hypothetical protein